MLRVVGVGRLEVWASGVCGVALLVMGCGLFLGVFAFELLLGCLL